MNRLTTALIATVLILSLLGFVPTGTAAPSWVSSSGMEELPNGVQLTWDAVVTEPYARIDDPRQIVRLVHLRADLRFGNIQLRGLAQVAGVFVDRADPVTMNTPVVDLGSSLADTALTLGVELPDDTAGGEVQEYVASLKPAAGRTWATVNGPFDVILEVSPKPGR